MALMSALLGLGISTAWVSAWLAALVGVLLLPAEGSIAAPAASVATFLIGALAILAGAAPLRATLIRSLALLQRTADVAHRDTALRNP